LWAIAAFAMLAKAFHQQWKQVVPAWLAALGGSFGLVYGVVGFDPAAGYLMWGVWSAFFLFGRGSGPPPALVEEPLSPGLRARGLRVTLVCGCVCCSSPIAFLC